MRVKITTHFSDENADYRHADLSKPVYADVRDHIGEGWAKNGWCIIIPSEEKKVEPKAVIETPEDHTEAEGRETAALSRKRRQAP